MFSTFEDFVAIAYRTPIHETISLASLTSPLSQNLRYCQSSFGIFGKLEKIRKAVPMCIGLPPNDLFSQCVFVGGSDSYVRLYDLSSNQIRCRRSDILRIDEQSKADFGTTRSVVRQIESNIGSSRGVSRRVRKVGSAYNSLVAKQNAETQSWRAGYANDPKRFFSSWKVRDDYRRNRRDMTTNLQDLHPVAPSSLCCVSTRLVTVWDLAQPTRYILNSRDSCHFLRFDPFDIRCSTLPVESKDRVFIAGRTKRRAGIPFISKAYLDRERHCIPFYEERYSHQGSFYSGIWMFRETALFRFLIASCENRIDLVLASDLRDSQQSRISLFRPHGVTCGGVAVRNREILCGTSDGGIAVWDLRRIRQPVKRVPSLFSGEERQQRRLHQIGRRSGSVCIHSVVRVGPDQFVSASSLGDVAVWKFSVGDVPKVIRRFPAPCAGSEVVDLKYCGNPKEEVLASGNAPDQDLLMLMLSESEEEEECAWNRILIQIRTRDGSLRKLAFPIAFFVCSPIVVEEWLSVQEEGDLNPMTIEINLAQDDDSFCYCGIRRRRVLEILMGEEIRSNDLRARFLLDYFRFFLSLRMFNHAYAICRLLPRVQSLRALSKILDRSISVFEGGRSVSTLVEKNGFKVFKTSPCSSAFTLAVYLVIQGGFRTVSLRKRQTSRSLFPNSGLEMILQSSFPSLKRHEDFQNELLPHCKKIPELFQESLKRLRSDRVFGDVFLCSSILESPIEPLILRPFNCDDEEEEEEGEFEEDEVVDSCEMEEEEDRQIVTHLPILLLKTKMIQKSFRFNGFEKQEIAFSRSLTFDAVPITGIQYLVDFVYLGTMKVINDEVFPLLALMTHCEVFEEVDLFHAASVALRSWYDESKDEELKTAVLSALEMCGGKTALSIQHK